jgi:predicted SprT family Zn-dependent metalloprotease
MSEPTPHLGTEDRYSLSSECTDRELRSVVKIYAREVVDAHDLAVSVSELEWEISHRAKRRAGALYHADGQPERIQIARRQFDNSGWLAVASTIRHELIHAHLVRVADEPGHGERFERLAAELDTSVHCDRFSDPKYWVRCEDCDQKIPRYRESKLVKQADQFRCGDCGGRFDVFTAGESR